MPEFQKVDLSGGGIEYVCPECGEAVDSEYVSRYLTTNKAILSIVGLQGHGKTCFLYSLFLHLKKLQQRKGWTTFDYDPINPRGWDVITKGVADLENGQLPDPTRAVFPKPAMVEMSNIPTVGNVDAIFYDPAGELFDNADSIREEARFLFFSQTVVWLVNLQKLDNPEKLAKMLSNYRRASGQMCHPNNPDMIPAREQTLILVLTSGDQLLTNPTLPDKAREFLQKEANIDGSDYTDLDELSIQLGDWLDKTAGGAYANPVRNAKKIFAHVHFCAVSALGSNPQGQNQPIDVRPRNIDAPLWWVWRNSLPEIRLVPQQEDLQSQNGSTDTEEPAQKKKLKKRVFYSLDEAVRAAEKEPGTPELKLSNGVHLLTEPLTISRPLRMTGESTSKTLLTSVCEQYLLRCQSPTFEASKLTFRHVGASWSNVVEVAGETTATFSDCSFQGAITLVDRKVGGAGLVFMGTTSGTVTNCTAHENDRYGIIISTSGDLVEVLETHCHRNGRAGLVVKGQSTANIIGLTARHNHLFGAVLQIECKQVTIADSTCNENGMAGIYTSCPSQLVVLRKNTCNDNGKGEERFGSDEKGGVGIFLRLGAIAKLVNNLCRNNEMAGIVLTDNAKAELVKNSCGGKTQATGILIDGTAEAMLKENSCDYNQCGIAFKGSASGSFSGDKAHQNHGDGFLLSTTGSVTGKAGIATSNRGCGVHITNKTGRAVRLRAKDFTLGNNKRDFADSR